MDANAIEILEHIVKFDGSCNKVVDLRLDACEHCPLGLTYNKYPNGQSKHCVDTVLNGKISIAHIDNMKFKRAAFDLLATLEIENLLQVENVSEDIRRDSKISR